VFSSEIFPNVKLVILSHLYRRLTAASGTPTLTTGAVPFSKIACNTILSRRTIYNII